MHMLGESAWWMPRWLGRILPTLDVEGTSLTEHLDDADGGANRPSVVSLAS